MSKFWSVLQLGKLFILRSWLRRAIKQILMRSPKSRHKKGDRETHLSTPFQF